VIAAELDKGVPPSDMERVATEIPNANYTLINNAGHIANLDQPEAFNQALIKHFHNSI
jgi:pimeloyl-ACP methyl ester carboxylesterase